MKNKLWKATGEIVKTFSSMRKKCDDEGMPLEAKVIINFYNSLDEIEKKYNAVLDRDKLVNCYYSFMEAHIDTDHPSYKQFREVLISYGIIKEKD